MSVLDFSYTFPMDLGLGKTAFGAKINRESEITIQIWFDLLYNNFKI